MLCLLECRLYDEEITFWFNLVKMNPSCIIHTSVIDATHDLVQWFFHRY